MKKAANAFDYPVEDGAAVDVTSPPREAEPSIVVRLFREHARHVQRFLSFRLRDSEDGREASQEVFLKLWRHERSGTLRDEATNYMYSATRSIAADVERHRSRHPETSLPPEALPETVAPTPGPEDVLYWRRAMERFVHILQGLPEVTRQVLVLYHVNEMDYDQIAERLGISRRTVERHVARAVAQCRRRMRDYL